MFVQIFGVRECLVVKVKFIMLREEDREYLKSLSPEGLQDICSEVCRARMRNARIDSAIVIWMVSL